MIDTAMLRLVGPMGAVDLTGTELRILARLASCPLTVVSVCDLIDAAWPGVSAPITLDGALRVHIARLRDKLEAVGLSRESLGNRPHLGYYLEVQLDIVTPS